VRGLAAALCLVGQGARADCLALPDLGYVLPVDGEVAVTVQMGLVTIDLAPGGRAPRIIALVSLAKKTEPIPEQPKHEVLPNGLTLHYSARTGEAVGSGGAEVRLAGWLEGETPLGVSCSTQGETVSPDWCLPVLGELRLEAEGCKTVED
jgi:hypothetical protein